MVLGTGPADRLSGRVQPIHTSAARAAAGAVCCLAGEAANDRRPRLEAAKVRPVRTVVPTPPTRPGRPGAAGRHISAGPLVPSGWADRH